MFSKHRILFYLFFFFSIFIVWSIVYFCYLDSFNFSFVFFFKLLFFCLFFSFLLLHPSLRLSLTNWNFSEYFFGFWRDFVPRVITQFVRVKFEPSWLPTFSEITLFQKKSRIKQIRRKRRWWLLSWFLRRTTHFSKEISFIYYLRFLFFLFLFVLVFCLFVWMKNNGSVQK